MVVAVGETLTEPKPSSSRVMERLPGLMTALTALVEATVSVAGCPAAMAAGEAVSVAVGAGVTVTKTVAVAVELSAKVTVTV